MKLYMKQKVFTWKDRFTIRDESNKDIFAVEGKTFSFGKKLHVYDMAGHEVCYIEQKVMSFRPRYYVHIGAPVYKMVKDITFMRSSYRLEGLPLKLSGNFMGREYSLTDGRQTLMRVYKEWFTWGDSYALDVADPQSALLCLCMVLVVDCVVASESNA